MFISNPLSVWFGRQPNQTDILFLLKDFFKIFHRQQYNKMNATDKDLWEEIKQEIKEKYKKRWNAFYSGLLVQEYKKRGGKFIHKPKVNEKNNELKRWYAEEWKNINDKNDVIVFRPTKRITKDTPVTASEIDENEKKKKIKEKKKIQNTNKNLTKFKPKAK